MHSLVQKMRESRQIRVDVSGMVFLAMRPTDIQAAKFHRNINGLNLDDGAKECVYGWENVKASDIMPKMSDDIIDFKEALWREWIDDNSDLWEPISTAVISAYSDAKKEKTSAEKNL